MNLIIDHLLKNQPHYRFERKYCIPNPSLDGLEWQLETHAMGFREVHPKRCVNNIYLDTPGLRFYHDNLDGSEWKIKFRIRWYGRLWGEAESPYLEIKIKKSIACYKLRFPLQSFTFDDRFALRQLRAVFRQSDIPDFVVMLLNDLDMTLINRYARKYYLSMDKQFRATLDERLEFYPAMATAHRSLYRAMVWEDTILEIKYAHDRDDQGRKVITFPYRFSRHSKYVRGIELVNFL